MAENKMCNTINQNIEPYTGKLVINYFKQFGTLLNGNNNNTTDKNNLSPISINQHSNTQDESNISGGEDYSDPDTEFHEILEEVYMDPNSVWDRGKITNQPNGIPDDVKSLRRLENTVTNLEMCLESLPNQEPSSLTSQISQISRSLTVRFPSPPPDDTLSDVDLERFNTTRNDGSHVVDFVDGTIGDTADTASLSNFHNVRDVLMNIRGRLESYLRGTQETSTDVENAPNTNLEGNISDLKRELERYVNIINEKNENELRKFSENMTKQSNILQMKKAFKRKEKLKTNIYETVASRNLKYAIPDESLTNSLRYYGDGGQTQTADNFTMRNCYDDDYVFQTYSDFSSVEYYTMLINEERAEHLLNDAPPRPRYHDREKISLIFRDSQNIIKEWQNFQLKTIQIKPKKAKSLKSKWKKSMKVKTFDAWGGFTLDSHQNDMLQLKLEKERRIRLGFRLLFYFLSVVFFVLIVFLSQSMFTLKKRESRD